MSIRYVFAIWEQRDGTEILYGQSRQSNIFRAIQILSKRLKNLRITHFSITSMRVKLSHYPLIFVQNSKRWTVTERVSRKKSRAQHFIIFICYLVLDFPENELGDGSKNRNIFLLRTA